MIINFATTNKDKIQKAQQVFANNPNIELNFMKIDCHEIQHDNQETVAKSSARRMSVTTGKSIVKIDAGLYIEALNGFPSIYSEYVERTLSAQNIIDMMQNEDNRRAYYKHCMAYCEYGKEPIVFTTYTYGSIAEDVDVIKGYPFDKIFIADGDTVPMSSLSDEDRISRYSSENWENLYKHLTK